MGSSVPLKPCGAPLSGSLCGTGFLLAVLEQKITISKRLQMGMARCMQGNAVIFLVRIYTKRFNVSL